MVSIRPRKRWNALRGREVRTTLHAFDQNYSLLAQKFSKLAKSEDSVYLPSIRPIGQVDYVFVGMEPSLGRWAQTREEAEEKVGRGFKNFMFSVEDFILHHCIRKYLCCDRDSTYYITDLSKGALLTMAAIDKREERYRRWLPLFNEELKLVKKETTKLIAIGKDVRDFLGSNGFSSIYMILHYSQQAARYRNKWIDWDEKAFENFKQQVSKKDIIATARAVTQQAKMDWILTSASLRKLETQDLTNSQKMLMFGYKYYFTKQVLGLASEPL